MHLNDHESIVQPANFYSGWLSSTWLSDTSFDSVHFMISRHREVGLKNETRLISMVVFDITSQMNYNFWRNKKVRKSKIRKMVISRSDIQSTLTWWWFPLFYWSLPELVNKEKGARGNSIDYSQASPNSGLLTQKIQLAVRTGLYRAPQCSNRSATCRHFTKSKVE